MGQRGSNLQPPAGHAVHQSSAFYARVERSPRQHAPPKACLRSGADEAWLDAAANERRSGKGQSSSFPDVLRAELIPAPPVANGPSGRLSPVRLRCKYRYTGGKWVQAKSGKRFSVVDLGTGRDWASCPDNIAEDRRWRPRHR